MVEQHNILLGHTFSWESNPSFQLTVRLTVRILFIIPVSTIIVDHPNDDFLIGTKSDSSPLACS